MFVRRRSGSRQRRSATIPGLAPRRQHPALDFQRAAEGPTAPGSGHDFGRLSVLHPGASSRTAGVPSTRSVDGAVSEEEVVTATGSPAPAPGVTPPTPAPPTPARNCHVASGPSYTPTGSIPVTRSGGRKRASFSMAASFDTDSTTGRVPSCCEVRQYIQWDAAFHKWRGGPPHSGFPSSATAGTWYEDRDTSDKRYGHRSGTHSDPIAGCGDEYRTGGKRDQANGDTYCGRDRPGGPTSMTGKFSFQLKVVDTCSSNAVRASSSVITVDWT